MGYVTYFLAVCPHMAITGDGDGWWDYYLRVTGDIEATQRGEAKLHKLSKLRLSMFVNKLRARRRTAMFWRTVTSRLVTVPSSLRQFVLDHKVEAILCNHYFNLPLAEKIRKWTGDNAKVVCETQDVQARHMIKTDGKHPLTGERGTYESYIWDECKCCQSAQEFIHLNEDEFELFSRRIPDKRHHLIFPSVPRPLIEAKARQDVDFLCVYSANPPNYTSLCWFLDEVWDHELNAAATLRIIGNIDYMFHTQYHDERYRRYGDIFVGHVDDVADWYPRAKTVLAPATEGQGISIKTLEALSYARPFLFSPLALRGFGHRAEAENLPGLCATATSFKTALWERIRSGYPGADSSNRDYLRIYDRLFSPEVYLQRFCQLFSGTGVRELDCL